MTPFQNLIFHPSSQSRLLLLQQAINANQWPVLQVQLNTFESFNILDDLQWKCTLLQHKYFTRLALSSKGAQLFGNDPLFIELKNINPFWHLVANINTNQKYPTNSIQWYLLHTKPTSSITLEVISISPLNLSKILFKNVSYAPKNDVNYITPSYIPIDLLRNILDAASRLYLCVSFTDQLADLKEARILRTFQKSNEVVINFLLDLDTILQRQYAFPNEIEEHNLDKGVQTWFSAKASVKTLRTTTITLLTRTKIGVLSLKDVDFESEIIKVVRNTDNSEDCQIIFHFDHIENVCRRIH